MCIEGVKHSVFNNAIMYVPYEKLTEKICLEAVKKNGFALQYIPNDKRTEAVCIEAVNQIIESLDKKVKEKMLAKQIADKRETIIKQETQKQELSEQIEEAEKKNTLNIGG
jgi:hypothetical protein